MTITTTVTSDVSLNDDDTISSFDASMPRLVAMVSVMWVRLSAVSGPSTAKVTLMPNSASAFKAQGYIYIPIYIYIYLHFS